MPFFGEIFIYPEKKKINQTASKEAGKEGTEPTATQETGRLGLLFAEEPDAV